MGRTELGMWALVLAGGRSRRMGRPKKDLPFGSGTLLERVVAAAREAAEQVVVVGDPAAAARLGVRSAEDLEPGGGPLSALAGGLEVAPAGLHALLACDLPFLDAGLLRSLEALSGDADAVVPEVEGRLHPLCALYRRSCLEPARACIGAGRRRMDDLLDRVRVRTVRAGDLPDHDLERAVWNVNTPDDYRRARERMEGM